jgi:hypothetical protein
MTDQNSAAAIFGIAGSTKSSIDKISLMTLSQFDDINLGQELS